MHRRSRLVVPRAPTPLGALVFALIVGALPASASLARPAPAPGDPATRVAAPHQARRSAAPRTTPRPAGEDFLAPFTPGCRRFAEAYRCLVEALSPPRRPAALQVYQQVLAGWARSFADRRRRRRSLLAADLRCTKAIAETARVARGNPRLRSCFPHSSPHPGARPNVVPPR